mmetsp:Transcript_39668/g.78126  ORF Transcript_39668/g.78126 Transcript_39668/m.78126 type:complete len:86 (+) Transcript_39668:53-310(+)
MPTQYAHIQSACLSQTSCGSFSYASKEESQASRREERTEIDHYAGKREGSGVSFMSSFLSNKFLVCCINNLPSSVVPASLSKPKI